MTVSGYHLRNCRPERRPHLLLSMIAFLAAVNLVACDSDSAPSTGDYGPLAVLHAAGGFEARGGVGTIDLGDDCVTLTNEAGLELLLIWHQHEEGWVIDWNEKEREIKFSEPGEPAVTIRDGDIITVGGASLIGDVPVEQELEWLAPPHESCTGEQWMVSSVTKEP